MEAAITGLFTAASLGLVAIVGLVGWRVTGGSKNGSSQRQIDLVTLNGTKIDTIATALSGQHETLREILQVQRETKDAIISNGRSR